jgi:pimeloyl-ACP methyl ester carboxylesterase
MIIKVNDIEMYYEIHGKGDPLIMIHGLGGSSETWDPFWKHFSKFYQTILFDLRGSGRSSKPNIDYSIRMMADDVAGLLNAINIQNTHVFGYSLGGMVAQELALNYPQKVKSLILAVTTCGGPQEIQATDEIQNIQKIKPNPPPGISMDELMHIMWSRVFSPNYVKKNRDKLIKEFMTRKAITPQFSFRKQEQARYMWEGSYERLSAIRCPTLVIGGEKDALIPPENSIILAEQIPKAKLKVLKDAPHLLIIEKEEELAVLMLDFLSKN